MPRKERGGGGAADGGKGAKNPLADMFNLQMPDDDEEGLMAELAALQGVKPPSKGLLLFFPVPCLFAPKAQKGIDTGKNWRDFENSV